MIFPLSNTRVFEQSFIIDSSCVTIIIVCFPFILSITCFIAYPVSLSKALVISSSKMIFEFLIRALAIPSLCFCPPLNFTPP